MKKTIITIMLAIVSMATFAQKEPGTFTLYPRIGINFSRMSNSEIYEMVRKKASNTKVISRQVSWLVPNSSTNLIISLH